MSKQNKFTRSIQERQAALDAQQLSEVEVESVYQMLGIPLPDMSDVKEDVPFVEPDISLTALLSGVSSRRAKNKTFYLDQDVIDAVRIAAKSQGITESRLVNEVLRSILKVR